MAIDTVESTIVKNTLPLPTKTKDLLKFITCGSVDDGKSTLIGRLLYDTNATYDNEIETLIKDSKRFGTTGDDIDYALLVDGLSSEREQGITIDVAYRFFSTKKRKFIVADTPGHEQYTRNMATGASTADCAVIMVDARKGLLPQTKRHSFITSMMGIKKAIIAINKIDLMQYNKLVFEKIRDDYKALSDDLEFNEIIFIPVSALKGDNLTKTSINTPWYQGPSLLSALEEIEPEPKISSQAPFRMCVQWVNRPNLNFRGYTGTVNQGAIKKGDKVTVLPQNIKSTIKDIITFEKTANEALSKQSITLTLTNEIDISRGDVICADSYPPETGNTFQIKLLWMSHKPLITGRQYFYKSGTMTTTCIPTKLKHQVDINTLKEIPSTTLSLNEIGIAELSTTKTIVFEPYKQNQTLGSFILIDRETNETAACGCLNFALRRSGNIHHQSISVSQQSRSAIKGHKPCVIWFTGISGAGKSTIANELEVLLNEKTIHTTLLDGDNIRFGLNKDLGFTEGDRVENIRRIAEVSKLMSDAGLITLVSFISPFKEERHMAKHLIGEANFIEVFVDTELSVAEKRDIKGLYHKAREGEIKNFTGISSPYEKPEKPDIHIKTSSTSSSEAAKIILKQLKEKSIL